MDYEDNLLDFVISPTLLDGIPVAIIQRIDSTTYTALFIAVDAEVRNRVPTAFIQDSWSPTQHVRINAGLRWSAQYLYAGDSIAQKITGQWQPRLGLIYRTDPSQKIFASYGRFYQQIPLSLSATSHVVRDVGMRVYNVDPRQHPDGFTSVVRFSDPDLPECAKVEGIEGEHFDEFIVGLCQDKVDPGHSASGQSA